MTCSLSLSVDNLLSLNHLHFLKVGEIMLPKYGHLILPGALPDKVTPDIDFIDEAVVQC